MNRISCLAIAIAILSVLPTVALAEPPAALSAWLDAGQDWQRDTDGPIVALGPDGEFDDTHIFAPTATRDANGEYRVWYCGSTGTVAERVFQLGLATSRDGRTFQRHAENPVFDFGDRRHSVLTPSVLRDTDGRPILEDGRMRMWFSSTWFEDPSGLHTLHETSSEDGVSWAPPSEALLDHCYAPSILETDGKFEMWYTDVSGEPWIIRHASSPDGRKWSVTAKPSIVIDQAWEKQNLFYPHVIRIGGVYLMWYGSYWTQRASTTALGFAASVDGVMWHKSSANPVLRPDPERAWESHYVTSHTMIRDPGDGSLRAFFASRTKPPHVNKYFAINTAVWKMPPSLADAGDEARER